MVGELVMDRFRLEERIGAGGMGTVYRAFDERLQRHVAVKEVMVGAPERVAREAQAAARLNHPGIVALFEFAVDGHRALLVSELIEGATLADLTRSGELCDRDVGELGADVCEALLHAHGRGVVHRDVKPQNVIAREDEGAGRRAKLMDFGIASLAGSPTLTATGEVIGTLAYMSPEQAEGEAVGAESDTYSLALTLYECWAGENPVRRPTPAQTARAVGGAVPPLAEYRPDLPPLLCAAVDACLDPDPARRLPLDELGHALERTIPELDCDYALPAPEGEERSSKHVGRPALARLGAIAAALGACTLAAGPLGLPGVALLAAVLVLPSLAIAASLAHSALPAAATALGAVSAGGAYPALAGALERGPLTRLALGALGWCWLIAGSAALGIAPPAGIAEPPPAGWDASAGVAFDSLLAPLFEPVSLLGMAAFGLGAAAFGWILSFRHLATTALGAIVWAAVLAGVLRLAGDGGLDWAPLVIAASAAVAVASEHRSRQPRLRFAAHDAAPAGVPLPRPASPH